MIKNRVKKLILVFKTGTCFFRVAVIAALTD